MKSSEIIEHMPPNIKKILERLGGISFEASIHFIKLYCNASPDDFSSVSDSIWGCFTWAETPQGQEYWSKFHKQVGYLEN